MSDGWYHMGARGSNRCLGPAHLPWAARPLAMTNRPLTGCGLPVTVGVARRSLARFWRTSYTGPGMPSRLQPSSRLGQAHFWGAMLAAVALALQAASPAAASIQRWLQLAPGAGVEGQVTAAADGRPVAGALVTIPAFGLETTADAD